MTKDMTTGSPLRIILLFSIPVLLGNLFQQFYNMVDTIIVGRYLGEEALAAVGSTGCLMFLVLGFANGIAQGFGVMVSHAFGAKDYIASADHPNGDSFPPPSGMDAHTGKYYCHGRRLY